MRHLNSALAILLVCASFSAASPLALGAGPDRAKPDPQLEKKSASDATEASAAETPAEDSDSTPSHPASAFMLQAGLSWSIGNMGFKSGAFQTRTLNALAIKVFPAYDLQRAVKNLPFKLIIGPFAEFRFVGQLTDPNDAATLGAPTNLRGTGYLLGLGLGIELEKWSIIASLDPFGAHYLTNRIPSDLTSSFSSPFGARVVVGYMIKRNISIDANFQYAAYDSNNVVGDMGTDALTQTLFGVGARYFFDL